MTTQTFDLQHGTIDIVEQGAHLSSWKCEGQEQLFLSKQAIYEKGTALRGGVPICFPQFAAFGTGQKHGFARNMDWKLKEQGVNHVLYGFSSNEETLALWPHAFELFFRVELSQRALHMSLSVLNTGEHNFEFGAALHSYFYSPDVRNAKIQGLQNELCWDNGTPFDQRYQDEKEFIEINGPIDRVYFNTQDTLLLQDDLSNRHIGKTGFKDVVVWNPWKEDAEAMKDMRNIEYLNMICIEAANVETPVQLKSGEKWSGQQSIKLL